MSGFGIGGGNLPHDEDGLPSVPASPGGYALYADEDDPPYARHFFVPLNRERDFVLDGKGIQFEWDLRRIAKGVGWFRLPR